MTSAKFLKISEVFFVCTGKIPSDFRCLSLKSLSISMFFRNVFFPEGNHQPILVGRRLVEEKCHILLDVNKTHTLTMDDKHVRYGQPF